MYWLASGLNKYLIDGKFQLEININKILPVWLVGGGESVGVVDRRIDEFCSSTDDGYAEIGDSLSNKPTEDNASVCIMSYNVWNT